MPSWPEAVNVKGPPEPKSRVICQRTPKSSLPTPDTPGALVPQFSLIAVSVSVRFGVPVRVVLAKYWRRKVGLPVTETSAVPAEVLPDLSTARTS